MDSECRADALPDICSGWASPYNVMDAFDGGLAPLALVVYFIITVLSLICTPCCSGLQCSGSPLSTVLTACPWHSRGQCSAADRVLEQA